MMRASILLALAAVAAACRGPVELPPERPIAVVAPGASVPAPPVRPSSSATTTLATSYRGAAATPTGVVVPVLGTSADGWLVGTPCGRTVSVRNVRAVTGTVVLDAGHGGEETGAIGPLGHKESALNTAVVAHARRALQAAGVSAVLTRTDDYRIAIVSRAAIVGAVKPKAVVSIHHNASFSQLRDTPGTEIFHQGVGASAAESRRLSGLLYEEVTATLARYDVSGWGATAWAGVKARRNATGDDFYGMLRRTQGTPAALVEWGSCPTRRRSGSTLGRSFSRRWVRPSPGASCDSSPPLIPAGALSTRPTRPTTTAPVAAPRTARTRRSAEPAAPGRHSVTGSRRPPVG
ncbi:MAG TPA: N-acetylmuramoyl-L-alanine amidase [Acidimicrobiia bacterium]|nr:N-acetylmuramoyl-L-alanine amidase [Acidimicrobiia bacterium]